MATGKAGNEFFETKAKAAVFAARKIKNGFRVNIVEYYDGYNVYYERPMSISQMHRRETRIYRKGGYSYPEDSIGDFWRRLK